MKLEDFFGIKKSTLEKAKHFVNKNFVLSPIGPAITNSCRGSVCVGCTSHCANSCTGSCEGMSRK